MTISPVSPTEPEPSWQPLRRQVTFNDRIEFYNGAGQGATHTNHEDEAIELGVLSKDKISSAGQLEASERRPSRRTICCVSRKTFFVLVVVAVFLLGGLLGGVAATQINKKPDTAKTSKSSSTYTGGGFPTMTHARPITTPTGTT